MHIDSQIDASTRFGRHAADVIVRVGDDAPVTLQFTTWVFP